VRGPPGTPPPIGFQQSTLQHDREARLYVLSVSTVELLSDTRWLVALVRQRLEAFATSLWTVKIADVGSSDGRAAWRSRRGTGPVATDGIGRNCTMGAGSRIVVLDFRSRLSRPSKSILKDQLVRCSLRTLPSGSVPGPLAGGATFFWILSHRGARAWLRAPFWWSCEVPARRSSSKDARAVEREVVLAGHVARPLHPLDFMRRRGGAPTRAREQQEQEKRQGRGKSRRTPTEARKLAAGNLAKKRPLPSLKSRFS
jgi:hypothetical protein